MNRVIIPPRVSVQPPQLMASEYYTVDDGHGRLMSTRAKIALLLAVLAIITVLIINRDRIRPVFNSVASLIDQVLTDKKAEENKWGIGTYLVIAVLVIIVLYGLYTFHDMYSNSLMFNEFNKRLMLLQKGLENDSGDDAAEIKRSIEGVTGSNKVFFTKLVTGFSRYFNDNDGKRKRATKMIKKMLGTPGVLPPSDVIDKGISWQIKDIAQVKDMLSKYHELRESIKDADY